MPFSWKRSSNLEFPLVYSKFKALSCDGTKQVTYRIEDVQRDRFDDVLEIMKNKHLRDEPMYSSKGVCEDLISFQEMINNWQNMLEQHTSLICFEESSNEIVAVNILGVVTEAEFDAPNIIRGKAWREVNNLKKFLKKNFFDSFKHYKVDKIMFAAGLFVDEKFRNRGIAVEMLRARGGVALENKIEVSSNVFSSLSAQKAAIKAGFEESFSIKYSEIAVITSDGKFPLIKDEHLKIMSKKFY